MSKRRIPPPEQLDLFAGGGPRGLVPNADLCTSRHRGAETSVAAFESTKESTRQRQRDSVLTFVKGATNGATCEETALALSIPYTAASARFTELQRLELIAFGEETRKTTHGKSARVYRVRT